MNIIRLYNQNRKQIFKVVFVIASIILAIHFVNYLIKQDNNENLNSVINSSSTGGATTINQSQQSAISSSSVSDKTYKTQSELIDKFMKYCNEGNNAKAYDLLSSDCKEVMFPTLEDFKNNYQKGIFSEERIYSIQNWIGSTYKIRITEDILSTGISNNGIAIEDYFTIVNDNGNNKLNIDGFVNRTQLNDKNSDNNIEIKVTCRDTYMDYVIYTLNIANNTDKTVCLDSGESTQNMYIVDNNDIKHMSARNEVVEEDLIIDPNTNKDIKIKYLSGNISTRTIESLGFRDIILDFNTYKTYTVKKDYINRTKIEIEF